MSSTAARWSADSARSASVDRRARLRQAHARLGPLGGVGHRLVVLGGVGQRIVVARQRLERLAVGDREDPGRHLAGAVEALGLVPDHVQRVVEHLLDQVLGPQHPVQEAAQARVVAPVQRLERGQLVRADAGDQAPVLGVVVQSAGRAGGGSRAGGCGRCHGLGGLSTVHAAVGVNGSMVAQANRARRVQFRRRDVACTAPRAGASVPVPGVDHVERRRRASPWCRRAVAAFPAGLRAQRQALRDAVDQLPVAAGGGDAALVAT